MAGRVGNRLCRNQLYHVDMVRENQDMETEGKSTTQSKTIIVNIVALVAILGSWGLDLNAEQVAVIAAVVLPVLNIGLRLITKQPVNLFAEEKDSNG